MAIGGFSFDPSGDSANGYGRPQDGGAIGGQALSPQDAVKLLSLRIPRRPSVSGIAPQSLLLSRGMGGSSLSDIIRLLAGGQMQGMPGMQGMGAETPRVIPGLEDPKRPFQISDPSQPDPQALAQFRQQFRGRVPTGGFSGGMNWNPMPAQVPPLNL